MPIDKRKERLNKRNKAIRERYLELNRVKYNEIALFSEEAIFKMISDEFYLSEATIENIVKSN